MADNLPLIPKKEGICAEVRPLLRTVFRELDYLPPLSIEEHAAQPPLESLRVAINQEQLPALENWTDKYEADCEQIWNHEGEIKEQHAKRLARVPLPNIYQLHPPLNKTLPQWRLDRGLIDRRDLKPTIEQNAGRDGTLWIKNILNASSGDVTQLKSPSMRIHTPVKLSTIEDNTIQTLSIGCYKNVGAPPHVYREPPASSLRTDCIVCIPTQLAFVNFVIGHVHTQSMRLMNVSKYECRLSLTPPKHQELTVELCSPRGLTVTAGAVALLKVHFRPEHVRTLHDHLVVRVSCGQEFDVSIACYMQPPVLDILVPNVPPSLLFCTPDKPVPTSIPEHLVGGPDVVELGAQLLGNLHHLHLLLHCDAEYATFFVLTEDAWISWNLDCLTLRGSAVAGPFVFWPAWWRGGGVVSACVWCRGEVVGSHVTLLKILSSTAINRHLYLMADVVQYKPNHLTIEAHPKDYDICSEDDPDCEYYVNVGSTFPHRSLSTTIKLHNNSPVVYSYYWASRAWGVCCCWEEGNASQTQLGPEDDSNYVCPGALEDRNLSRNDPERYERKLENSKLVSIEPGRSQILPRTSCTLQVRLPDVGGRLGVQRAVLMLIIKDVPKESFPDNFEPAIVSTKEVETIQIPGLQGQGPTREVCEVLVAQMEVWWEVMPVKFVLEPAVLPLPHSRRLKSITINISAWQLFGWNESCVEWVTPERIPRPPARRLTPERSARTTIQLSLPALPNEYPEADVFTMVAANEEWKSECVVQRWCATRHPALQPVRAWLGVLRPATHLQTAFLLTNDTHQDICYWCEGFRWLGENPPAPACRGEIPCDYCQELACTCDFLKPRRGMLPRDHSTEICYDVVTPKRDGCVMTLVQARRCAPDLAQVHAAPATQARASLIAYHVLAPAVILRVLPCFGTNPECGEACGLDPGAAGNKHGTAILRPSAALVVGRCTCYRLRVTNLTPLCASVSFDEPIDGTEYLKVKFIPNNFCVRKYGQKEIRMVVEARRVCTRRLFVYRAQVQDAHRPVYLLVDTAVTGVQIACQVPVGGGRESDEFIIIKRTQRMKQCECDTGPADPEEMFEEEDRKRQLVSDNVCSCPYQMVYIPPLKECEPRSAAAEESEYPPIQFVTSPPALTRVCPCDEWSKPVVRDAPECLSLQFVQIPLRTVCERRLVLTNESVVTARWWCHVRRWPRRHTRTIDTDEWAGDVRAPGVVLACTPTSGTLAAGARHHLRVQVYADCWGRYRDQIVIQVDKVEPIVLDVWVHAVGAPLVFKMQPHRAPDDHPTLWLSAADPARVVRARNVSRADLLVHAYIAHENARAQDALPFRLYLRYLDELPPTCPCYTPHYPADMDEASEPSVELEEEVETNFELYLGPDLGPQCNEFYQVEPVSQRVAAGAAGEWRVRVAAPPYGDTAPPAALLLRLQPCLRAGSQWYRDDPAAQVVRLRQAPREDKLKLSCEEIVVKLCALNLPFGDFLRVRKYFHIQNLGNGAAAVNVYTSVPWCLVHRCDARCACRAAADQRMSLALTTLPPFSCTQVCVEVCISTVEAWPPEASGPAPYAPHRTETTPLHIYDNYQLLLTLPLTLDIEYPVIQTEPAAIDFGYVTDDDSRKTYVTVSHTSRTEVLNLKLNWIGCDEFEIWPPSLEIPPGGKARFYIQYTAVFKKQFVELVSLLQGRCLKNKMRTLNTMPYVTKNKIDFCAAIVEIVHSFKDVA